MEIVDPWVNFSYDEFRCRCGANHTEPRLVDLLQAARDVANTIVPGTKFVIGSGYRCRFHNSEVGGVPNSSHLRGLAADIYAEGSRRYAIVAGLMVVGVPRIGIYDNYIHCDIDNTLPHPRLWYGA